MSASIADMPPRTLSKQARVAAAPKPLATANELCEYLGISINTLYDWRKKGFGPPATKAGRFLRFDWSDVSAWQAERKSSAA